jgi:hypothetical protein
MSESLIIVILPKKLRPGQQWEFLVIILTASSLTPTNNPVKQKQLVKMITTLSRWSHNSSARKQPLSREALFSNGIISAPLLMFAYTILLSVRQIGYSSKKKDMLIPL